MLEKVVRPKGPSIVQQRFIRLVEKNAPFTVRGKSLICGGETFPAILVHSTGVRPKNVDQYKLNHAIK